ncbi:hypothetical protein SVIOM342S_01949 [Streptomyces violaceorubidus]
MNDLADELTLTAGADFTDRFSDLGVAALRGGSQLMEHPEAGPLRSTSGAARRGQADRRAPPADDATAAALDRGRRRRRLRADARRRGHTPGARRAMRAA